MATKLSLIKSKFARFLDFIVLKEPVQNKDAVLSFSKDKVQCLAISSDLTIGIRATMNGEFSDVGQLGISYLPDFAKYVKQMSDKFTFEIDKNKYKLVSKTTKVSSVLKNVDYVKTFTIPDESKRKFTNELFDTKMKTFEGGIQISLSKDTIEEILDACNTVKETPITFEGGKNKLVVKLNKTVHELVFEKEFEVVGEETYCFIVDQFFASLLELVKNEAKIIFNKDNPQVLFLVEEENLKVEYLVALKTEVEPSKN